MADNIIQKYIHALGDNTFGVSKAAAEALGRIGEPAVPYLIKTLQNENDSMRTAAAYALQEMGPLARKAVPNLIEALKDSHYSVRFVAAGALGMIGKDAKKAAPQLIEIMQDKKEPDQMRSLVQEVLEKIGAVKKS